MKRQKFSHRVWNARSLPPALLLAVVIPAVALALTSGSRGAAFPRQGKTAPRPEGAMEKPAPPGMTKLKIQVVGSDDKPVAEASVYIRFDEPGGKFHHDKLAELDLKTNLDGSVRVPPVPLGKIEVQVIAKDWHTFGKWYDVEKPEDTIEIRLLPPPHWY